MMKCGRNKYLFMSKVLFFEVLVEQSKSNWEVIVDHYIKQKLELKLSSN